MSNEEQSVPTPDPDTKEQAADVPQESKADPVDLKELRDQFEAFSKFGDKGADGKTIKLSQSDKWFKQAKVIDAKGISTTDTGIAFRKISKNSPKLSFTDWNKYLEEVCKSSKKDANTVRKQLISCGKPGFTGATEIAKTAALDRLTDTSRYGGTHKQRFDSSGKVAGKQGRSPGTDQKPANKNAKS